MAELTNLEDKLAEVLGLAMAAQDVTDKVKGLVDDEKIVEILQRMHEEAAETEQRCITAADQRDGKKTAILDKARETKAEAKDMMSTYLGGEDVDELDGFEFLSMAEAGEVGHWKVLGAINANGGEPAIGELVDWALPIQERHLDTVFECATTLAASEDPNAAS